MADFSLVAPEGFRTELDKLPKPTGVFDAGDLLRVLGVNPLTIEGVDSGAYAFPTTAGLTIVEVTTGVWSADAPVRTVGVNPIVFVGLSDPADVTNGIATPANINDRDRWVELASL